MSSTRPEPNAVDCPDFVPFCPAVDTVGDVVGDTVGDAVGDAASSAADSAIDRFAGAVVEAVGETVSTMSTLWVHVPSSGAASSSTAQWMQAQLWWLMAFAAVLSVIVAGARMAWEARAQPAKDLVKSLMTLVLVSGASLAVLQTALSAGDAFSVWIIDQGADGDFDRRVTTMLGAVATNQLGAMLVIVLGLVVILASVVQIMVMIGRSAVMILLAGILPLSASATNTSWGRQWFEKTAGWLIAFVLYKPAAAIVYATAFQAFGNEKGLLGSLTGIAMIVLAIAALPALIKLCVPAVGSLAGSAAGGGAGAAAGVAAMSMRAGSGPTGAVPVAAGAASRGSGGGGAGGGSAVASGAGGAGSGSAASPGPALVRSTGSTRMPAMAGGGAAAPGSSSPAVGGATSGAGGVRTATGRTGAGEWGPAGAGPGGARSGVAGSMNAGSAGGSTSAAAAGGGPAGAGAAIAAQGVRQAGAQARGIVNDSTGGAGQSNGNGDGPRGSN